MSFLYPSVLWALLALLIPIAVHLFNLRRHKLEYFSNTELLKTIHQENKRTRRLKHLVALLLRCVFIAALVLAFAFPYPQDTESALDVEEDVVGVYIDNSMSMKALSERTTLLDDARESARNLVRQYPPSTRFLLMTNSFEVQNEYPMNQEEMLDQLDRMSPDGPPMKMDVVLERFAMLRQYHGLEGASLFVYSDFQKNMLQMTGVQNDSTVRIYAIPLSAGPRTNLSIDTVWLGSPIMQAGLANEVHVVVHNRGDRAVQGVPVNLTMNERVVAASTVDVEPYGTAELLMQIVPEMTGGIRCTASLVDYPITFDDAYHFVVEPRKTLTVVELNSGNSPSCISLVFADDPQYDYVAMNPNRFDLHTLSKAQLVVVDATSEINASLRQALEEDAAEGASLLLFHDDGAVDTNKMAVTDLALRHDFFDDMILEMPQHADLPKAFRHVRLNPNAKSTTLIHLANGDPLLTLRQEGRGYIFDMATKLDDSWSSLADNALFVPLMLKMALLGGGVGKIAYTKGEDKILIFNDLDISGNLNLSIKDHSGSYDAVPSFEMRNNRLFVYLGEDLQEAGFYDLVVNDSVRHVMAWNDSRLESDMEFCSQEQVEQVFHDAGMEVEAMFEVGDFTHHDLMQALARKSTWWHWLVLLALLAIVGEAAVLRFWK